MKQEKLYWAPGKEWCVQDGELIITQYVFHGHMTSMFPDFYFLACKGTDLEQLQEAFPDYSKIKLKKFVHNLQNLNVLISNIQGTAEVFASQEKLFASEEVYDKDYFLNKDCLADFVTKQLTREVWKKGTDIELLESEVAEEWKDRKSTRKFAIDKKISRKTFCGLLTAMKQTQTGENRRYYYPSAGGLYPIDCYIHVKANRVEQIDEGLYYYNPVKHVLVKISEAKDFQCQMHYHLNKDIYETSAFSMYLFYNASVSMPKYESKGYYYGVLDAGILIGLLNQEAVRNGLGLCSIGDMCFEDIEENFKLKAYQKYLHCIEFGLEATDD